MAIASELMTDIDLRYRNTFSVNQKCVWMNDEQNNIFNTFKIDIGPVNFPIIHGVQFYPLPAEIEYIEQIRTATIQIGGSDTPEFIELPYKRDDNGVLTDLSYWYTIVGQDTLFINLPDGGKDDYQVYFYLDGAAPPITDESSGISVPRKYLEILKLGTLKRIAAARKDILMHNNYEAERMHIIDDMLWTAQVNEPEFISPADMMPRAGRRGFYGRNVAVITQTTGST